MHELSAAKNNKQSILSEVSTLLRENIRNYAMYIALFTIFILFYFLTRGTFLSARNLTNLVNQTGYVAVMAVGMTIVLIIQQIDLSVGYAAGFYGACAAILMAMNIPIPLVILLVLIFGVIAGTIQGLIVGKIGVPAFVTTLAFLFIFRGLLSLVTEATGTISIKNEFFNLISNGFVPSGVVIAGKHGTTLAVFAVMMALIIIMQIRKRQEMKRYQFEVISAPLAIIGVGFILLILGWLSLSLSGYNGLSWSILLVAAVTFIYDFILKKTRLGRHIYGVGGNREAAALAGINVQKTVIIAFASMGMMSALGGILYASRLRSATPTAGAGFELDTIASCFIGGVSTTGGIGKVVNSVIGAFVITSLTNGLNLMGVGISYQYIVKGVIFITAVAFDVRSQGRKAI
ncbi:MAG: sugar ABC transporter permease [Sphaerochaetaceae bacterium]